jgi:flagellar biosynthesis component FlhA
MDQKIEGKFVNEKKQMIAEITTSVKSSMEKEITTKIKEAIKQDLAPRIKQHVEQGLQDNPPQPQKMQLSPGKQQKNMEATVAENEGQGGQKEQPNPLQVQGTKHKSEGRSATTGHRHLPGHVQQGTKC